MAMKKLPLLMLTLTAINLGVLALNLTVRANAEVAGKDWFELAKDDDFRQAVGHVVGQCTIDADQTLPQRLKIYCGR